MLQPGLSESQNVSGSPPSPLNQNIVEKGATSSPVNPARVNFQDWKYESLAESWKSGRSFGIPLKVQYIQTTAFQRWINSHISEAYCQNQ